MNLFKKLDILAIGDLATEPFIKIKEAEAIYNKEDDDWKLCLDFGGKIPYESAEICRAVGNSSNFAIATSRLGLSSALVSYVGQDEIGDGNIKELKKEKVITKYIKKIRGLKSNYHYVLWFKEDRSILVTHTEFPYSFPRVTKHPKWMYLSSLAANSLSYHKEIIEYVKSHPGVSLVFQPGTLQIKFGVDSLKEVYENSKILICNKEEAEKIIGVNEMDIPSLLKKIHDLGPKIVVITNGIKGSYSFDGADILFMNSFYKKEKTIESTGAGDAFAAGFVTALSWGKDLGSALVYGSLNANSVVSFVGPHEGLLRKDEIEKLYESVPDGMKAEKIN